MMSRSKIFRSLTDSDLEKLLQAVKKMLLEPTPPAPRLLARALAPFMFVEIYSRLSLQSRNELQQLFDVYERSDMRGYVPALISECVSELDGHIKEAVALSES